MLRALYSNPRVQTGGDAVMPEVAPYQAGPVQPVLQLQDGSYVGTAWPGSTFSGTGPYMVKFSTSGNLLGTASGGYNPQIATSDGGVIATAGMVYGVSNGTTATFDANLNVTGKVASLPTQSWLGNAYLDGPLNQVYSTPVQYPSSYAAVAGGNPGTPGTHVPTLGAILRTKIADLAKSYVGNSTNWRETSGTTCNLFVRDVLTQASDECQLNIPAPVRPNLSWWQSGWRHPFLAADWANPNVDGGCWKTLPGGPADALPGDVLATGYPANGNDGTGHVGIIVSPSLVVDPSLSHPLTVRFSSAADEAPYWWDALEKDAFIKGTITLTDYGFRAPGFDPTNPNNVQGLETDSRVRRFSCY